MAANDHVDELRLRIFWLTHGRSTMRNAMKTFNFRISHCGCIACQVGGLCDDEDEFPNVNPCCFKSPFEHFLAERGFKISHEHEPNNCPLDVHFLNPGRGDWRWWGFGPALLRAKTPENAELRRYISFLHAVFGVLDRDEDGNAPDATAELWSANNELTCIEDTRMGYGQIDVMWPYRRGLKDAGTDADPANLEASNDDTR